ncbi:HD-GYP domain-containing protein [Thiorhodospira sibirica]|uniref:HD-GYP domain-containing protein n=1 Tax=Thiorhodospira sibirica TaxID=154347 RepID=UPI00022C0ACB|nr:HD domain-containing phosphohydrolase [Thiorhodospira sibirica]
MTDSYVGLLSATIMVVDDEPANLTLIDRTLRSEGYRHLVLIRDPREVEDIYVSQRFDLIILDLNMPYIDGFGVMEKLLARNDPILPPILVLTAQYGRDFVLRALTGGARDFLSKPFDRMELLARVRNLLDVQLGRRLLHDQKQMLEQLVHARTQELRNTRLQVVQRLGRAAEYRDNETGFHILRMSHTCALLAKSLGWNEADTERMLHASPMHDIGKIGIPDGILLKPGKLDPEEWEIMKTHATIGAHILDGDDSDLLVMAREIALTHHERWDGAGYPRGLAGDQIPLVGRIVAIADVFDALTSERPYKRAWTVEDALNYIRENNGRHFDPQIVAHFEERLPEILAIRERFSEPENQQTP